MSRVVFSIKYSIQPDFKTQDAYDRFEENTDERIDILMTKLSDMIKEQTTQYTTLFEVNNVQ
ncbi:MAG: hypothetical protein FD188_553 [Ignavibacteria bacterium]|nr:MAG: hypothetical protein FD188_553 [Ignavibacteria bacterium]